MQHEQTASCLLERSCSRASKVSCQEAAFRVCANPVCAATAVATLAGYPHISQKLLKGAASRVFIFWLAPIVCEVAGETEGEPHAAFLASTGVSSLKRQSFRCF